MRHARVARIAVAVTSLALLAACGGNDSTGPRQAGPSDPDVSLGGPVSDDGEDPFAHGPVTIRDAVKGGTVHVLTTHPPAGSLGPTLTHGDAVTSLLSGLVTRSLTQRHYDPLTRSTTLVPDLATDAGSHNDPYTRWQFRIRPGARFQDGTPVTARSVVRGIRRCIAMEASRPTPCRPVPIRKVTVRGHGYVRLDLDRPDPELPWQVASPAFGPSEAGRGGRTMNRLPPATGPYRIATYRPGHRLLLVRNRAWDASTDPGRTAYPDRFVVEAGRSARRIGQVIRGDREDAATTLTYDTVPARAADRRHWRQGPLVLGPTPCTTYLALDADRLTEPRVRKALAWAYPYRAMVRAAGRVPGITAVPAAALLPPPSFPAEPAAFHPPHAGFATSPRTARAILKRAHGLGTTVRIGSGADPALAPALAAAGFTPVATSSAGDLRIRTVCAHGSQGEAWLRAVYAGHPALMHRLRQIERLPLDQQRVGSMMRDRVALRVHWWVVPLWYDGVAMAHGSRIKGMADDSQLGMPAWDGLWVAP